MTVKQLRCALLALVLFLNGAWLGYCWHSDRLAWLPVLPSIGALLYLLIMMLEFALLSAVFDATNSSKPTLRTLLRALVGEVTAAIRSFCWHQAFRSNQYPDFAPDDAMGRRGVVLVHGYLCNRGLWNRWMPIFFAARVPTIAIEMPQAFASIASCEPFIQAAVSRMHLLTGQAPLVVAHSMGGLAVRYWWLRSRDASHAHATAPCNANASICKADKPIHHLVTLGTPHQGTWLARFAFSQNAREMRMDSAWLSQLMALEPASHRQATTCYFSSTDNVVFPAWCATLPDARSKRLGAAGHVALLDAPELLTDVLQLLQDVPPSAPNQALRSSNGR